MWNNSFFVWSIFLLFELSLALRPARIGEDCGDGPIIRYGICTVVTDCEEALSAIKEKKHHPFPRCGWRGGFEVICCPFSSKRFGALARKADEECKNIVKSSIGPINSYIIEGVEASIGEFPHMVGLGYNEGGIYSFRCGGTLISTSYVLTAAHCIENKEKVEPSIVRVGVVELGDGAWNDEIDYRIARSIVHPEYFRILKYNDIALLRLERSVKVSTIVSPACLYTSDGDPESEMIVTGWGRKSVRINLKSSILLKASVSVVGTRSCEPHYSTWKKLPRGIIAEQICAADPEGHKDACEGDSGGPLQMIVPGQSHYRVVGIISFGLGCSSPAPGVYTRVSRYLDWIESIVWS